MIADRLSGIPFLGRRLSDPASRRSLVNIAWLLADKFVRIGVGLLVGLWVARHLGPERYGDFNYVVAVVGMFAGFSSLGLESLLVRDLVNEPQRQGSLMGTALVLQGAGSVLLSAACLAVLLLWGSSGSGGSLGSVLASASILTGGVAALRSWFQYRVLSKHVVWMENGAYILVAVVKIVLIQLDAGTGAFLFAFLLETVLAAIGVSVAFARFGREIPGLRFDPSLARRTLRDGMPVAFSNLAILLYMKLDQVMIREMVDARELGLYSAAVRICEMWYFIPITVVNTLFPTLIELQRSSEERFLLGVRRLTGWLVWASIAVGLAVAVVSEPLIGLLYGSQYAPAARLLAVQIWSGLFVSVGVAGGTWIYARNRQGTNVVRSLVGLAANAGLNFLAIPRFGALGASLATIVSLAVANYGVNALLGSTRALFVLQVQAPYHVLAELAAKWRARRRPPSDPGDPS